MGKKCIFTFGRFQVPTRGHEELIRFVMQYAQRQGAEGRIYASKSQDANKNPLAYKDKVQYLRLLFPWANIIDDPKAVNAFAICRDLSDKGYDDVTFVVGDDRIREFETTIKRYILPRNDPKFDKTKHYAFKKFNVISSGARTEGVSGTDMRTYIRTGNFDKFFAVSPTKNKALAKRIFNSAKRNLNEEIIDETTARDLTKQLSQNGWKKQREGGSHEIWHHPEKKKSVAIPRHKGDFKKGLVHSIMKQTVVAEELDKKEFHSHLKNFVDYCCDYLGIEEQPKIRYKQPSEQGEQPSFAAYSPHNKEVIIMTKNRHPMDVFRSVAHELVHHKQNEDGRLGQDIAKEGSTGSDIENEANSEAGKVMRYFGRDNPYYFDMSYITERKAILLGGVPGSGKDRILKEAILPFNYIEISQDSFDREDCFGANLVINGSMANYDTTRQIKNILENHGYETIMIFVNTSNEVSKQRNEARADKGGRVLSETIRYRKWSNAQNLLEKYDKLFETVIEVQNDLDLNQSYEIVQATHKALIECVSNDVRKFTLTEADYKFENMLNEVGGAGNYGTPELTHRYQKDTPGQPLGFREMRVLSNTKKEDSAPQNAKQIRMPSIPIGADRIGSEVGMPKDASFGDNQTISVTPTNDVIARWMVREETRKLFKEKYGKLAEQKIKETARKLLSKESLDDPYSAFTGATPNAWNQDINIPTGGNQVDSEKQSIYGLKLRKKLNKNK